MKNKKKDIATPKEQTKPTAVDDWNNPETHEQASALWPLLGFALVLGVVLIYAVVSN
ncbi:MAG: hypothetical protein IPJ88_18465 [Myxococcales bacterium]|nr:MAG: hypothetical protein IPJ88_18465 [Myxococcales bacterium]